MGIKLSKSNVRFLNNREECDAKNRVCKFSNREMLIAALIARAGRILLPASLILILLCSLSYADQNLNWVKVTGPWSIDYEGTFNAVAIHPQNPNIFYIASGNLGGGVYRTTDGGLTWEGKNTGIQKLGPGPYTPPISKIVIAPSNPTTLYLGTAINNPLFKGGRGDVYKSKDGGETWQKVSGESNWLGVYHVYQIQGSVLDIAIDPRNPDMAFAGVSAQGIYKTNDGGTTWEKVFSASVAIGATDYFNVVRLTPTEPREIYISGFTYYSEDVIALPNFETTGTPGVLSIALRKSIDDGKTWLIATPTSDILTPPLITDLAIDVSRNIYIGTISYQTPLFYPVGNKGIFKYLYRTLEWKSINNINASASDLSALPIYSISLDHNIPNRLLISTGRNIFGSTNGGEIWELFSGLPSGTLVNRVAIAGNKLLALTSSGIYISTDPSQSTPKAPSNLRVQ